MCCSWNVRGLTDLKLIELVLHMKAYSIDILCIQETRQELVAVYEEQGYKVILSGSGCNGRSWAGVGIIVSPRYKHNIKSYKQVSDRICSVKMKVSGGIIGIICAYAPHNLKPLPDRFGFFSQLDGAYRSLSGNLGNVIFGDLNARLGNQLPGEDHIIGAHTFGRRAVHEVEVPNRDLLMELCESNSLLVANTFMPGTPDEKVTYAEPGSAPLGTITGNGYNMLDLLLCDQGILQKCTSLASIRGATLATDHYLVKSVLQFGRPRKPDNRSKRINVSALSEPTCRANFATTFCDTAGAPRSDLGVAETWEVGKAAMKAAVQTLPQVQKQARRPWISSQSLKLIDLRSEARARNDYEEEKGCIRKFGNLQKTTRRYGWINCSRGVTGSSYGDYVDRNGTDAADSGIPRTCWWRVTLGLIRWQSTWRRFNGASGQLAK